MAILKRFYSVYDAELSQYSVPFVAENDLIAQRQFFLMLDKYADTVLSQLELYALGKFDEDTGTISSDFGTDRYLVAKGEDIVKWRKEHAFKDKESA